MIKVCQVASEFDLGHNEAICIANEWDGSMDE